MLIFRIDLEQSTKGDKNKKLTILTMKGKIFLRENLQWASREKV